MLSLMPIMQYLLGIIVIISIIICKYFNIAKTFLLIMALVLMLYQRNINKMHNNTIKLEDTVVNISQFVIIAGVFGVVVSKIVGFFLIGFN
jgi:hypothetical protein